MQCWALMGCVHISALWTRPPGAEIPFLSLPGAASLFISITGALVSQECWSIEQCTFRCQKCGSFLTLSWKTRPEFRFLGKPLAPGTALPVQPWKCPGASFPDTGMGISVLSEGIQRFLPQQILTFPIVTFFPSSVRRQPYHCNSQIL